MEVVRYQSGPKMQIRGRFITTLIHFNLPLGNAGSTQGFQINIYIVILVKHAHINKNVGYSTSLFKIHIVKTKWRILSHLVKVKTNNATLFMV